jgi:predicted Zn-dependent protease
VARAEKAMEKGQHVAAAGMIIRMMPHIKSLKPSSSPLVSRAIHTLAVATARNDGALPLSKELPNYVQGSWIGKTGEDRAKNLDWSIGELRTLSVAKKDDAALETDLAEALSKVDSHKKEARQMLERLAKKDLVATPEGYAALARLRSESGDAAGTKLALKRCEAMADADAVCTARARG